MEQHLVTELKDLLAPMRGELTKIAEQAVKKVIRSTSFTLRADKTTLPQPELTLDELETQLFDKLASKFTLSPDETKFWEALKAKMSKETCSTEADKLKRQRDDEDRDPNSQAKKQKQAEGPSSQHKEPSFLRQQQRLLTNQRHPVQVLKPKITLNTLEVTRSLSPMKYQNHHLLRRKKTKTSSAQTRHLFEKQRT